MSYKTFNIIDFISKIIFYKKKYHLDGVKTYSFVSTLILEFFHLHFSEYPQRMWLHLRKRKTYTILELS